MKTVLLITLEVLKAVIPFIKERAKRKQKHLAKEQD